MLPKILQKQIKTQKLSHAYLILMAAGERARIAEEIQTLLEVKPVDVFLLESQEKIKIAEIRQLRRQLSLKPHSSPWKLAFILQGENLTPEASNCLLKTLEEPSAKSAIFLFAQEIDGLLPTIVSRCQRIKIYTAVQPKLEYLSLWQELKASQTLKAKFNLANKMAEQANILEILDHWIIFLCSNLLKNAATCETIKKILETKKILQTNANPRLAIESLFLELENDEINPEIPLNR